MTRLDSSVLNEFYMNSRESLDSTKGIVRSFHHAWKDFLQLIFHIIVLVGFLLQFNLFQIWQEPCFFMHLFIGKMEQQLIFGPWQLIMQLTCTIISQRMDFAQIYSLEEWYLNIVSKICMFGDSQSFFLI